MYRLPVFCVFLLCCLHFSAQQRWLRSYGSPSQDEAFDICSDGNGGYYVGGYFSSTAEFNAENLTSNGLGDAFVQSLDQDGITQWAFGAGGPQSDRIVSVAAYPDGGVVALGFFTSEILIDGIQYTAEQDSLQLFVTRLAPDGNVVWSAQCGGNHSEIPNDITVDSNGSIYITGQFRGEAQFGAFSLESSFYDSSTSYSYDVFVAKLTSNGGFSWAQIGSSDKDNRGLALTCDDLNNVYLAAEIGGDITFDQLHLNTVLNAGAIVKFNSSGQEQWYTQLSAIEVLPFDLKLTTDQRLRIVGDFSGNMAIQANSLNFYGPDYAKNVFLLELSTDADYLNFTSYGSENLLTGRALEIGEFDETYITGMFRCSFTEQNLEFGEGRFRSMGFNDIWMARVNNDGSKEWARHFGGPRNDFCSGIALRDEDRPMIAGSYSGYFHVPSNNSFLDVSETYPIEGFYPPNYFANFCNQGQYGEWKSIKASGPSLFTREIFITDALLLEKGPLDYYQRTWSSPCDFSAIPYCENSIFNPDVPFNCPDTILRCNWDSLTVMSYTGKAGIFGPSYSTNWSTGQTNSTIYTNTTDNYSVDISLLDGCYTQLDTVYQEFNPISPPSISDDFLINVQAIDSVEPILVCADSLVLWGGNLCNGCDGTWLGYNNDTITVFLDDEYQFITQDSLGCFASNTVLVDLDQSPDFPVGVPSMDLLLYANIVNSDTVSICPETLINIELPGTNYNLDDSELFAFYDYFYNGNLAYSDTGLWDHQFFPWQTGLYEIQANPFMYFHNHCLDSTIVYPTVSQWVYVEVLEIDEPNLNVEIDPFNLCPGDTAAISLSGCDYYEIISLTDNSSINIDQGVFIGPNEAIIYDIGFYEIIGYTLSTDSCIKSQSEIVAIESLPAPLAWTVPNDGVICPNDSLLISTIEGVSYQWVGPDGNLIDTTQTIYADIPGAYFCIVEDTAGCILESMFVELFEYSSPFLISEPGTEICFENQVDLEVFSNETAVVYWHAPVDLYSNTVTLYEAGTYTVSSTLCGITSEMEITLTNTFVDAIIEASGTAVCPSGSPVNLSADPIGNFSYEWLPIGLADQNIDVFEPGTYILNVSNELGCVASDTIEIELMNLNPPKISSESICYGDSTFLVALAQDDIFWSYSDDGNPISIFGDTAFFNNVQQDISIYAFVGNEFCSSLGSMATIDVYDYSITPNIFVSGPLCSGSDLNLSIQPYSDVDYLWTWPDNSTSNDSSIEILDASEDDSGIYQVQIFGEECDSPLNSIELDISPPIELSVDVLPGSVLCENELLIINVTNPNIDQLVWTAPSFLNNSTDPSLIVDSASVDLSGLYTINASDVDGCDMNGETSVYIVSYPDITLNEDALECDQGLLYISLDPTYDSYLWNNGEISSYVQVYEEGLWSVIVGNEGLCFTEDSIYIDDNSCIELPFNVVSDNGDGMNDVINFHSLGSRVESIIIYNRWGNEVRRLTGDLEWDNKTENGEDVCEGVYYWIALTKDNIDMRLAKRGYIHVFR